MIVSAAVLAFTAPAGARTWSSTRPVANPLPFEALAGIASGGTRVSAWSFFSKGGVGAPSKYTYWARAGDGPPLELTSEEPLARVEVDAAPGGRQVAVRSSGPLEDKTQTEAFFAGPDGTFGVPVPVGPGMFRPSR